MRAQGFVFGGIERALHGQGEAQGFEGDAGLGGYLADLGGAAGPSEEIDEAEGGAWRGWAAGAAGKVPDLLEQGVPLLGEGAGCGVEVLF